jgi:hypothetical protein
VGKVELSFCFIFRVCRKMLKSAEVYALQIHRQRVPWRVHSDHVCPPPLATVRDVVAHHLARFGITQQEQQHRDASSTDQQHLQQEAVQTS